MNISVGIDPASANATAMTTSVQNIVNTVNGLVATTGNLVSGGSNNIPSTDVDFESIALHEVIHALRHRASERRVRVRADRKQPELYEGDDRRQPGV